MQFICLLLITAVTPSHRTAVQTMHLTHADQLMPLLSAVAVLMGAQGSVATGHGFCSWLHDLGCAGRAAA